MSSWIALTLVAAPGLSFKWPMNFPATVPRFCLSVAEARQTMSGGVGEQSSPINIMKG
jgi:hypothetical protein